MKYRLRKIDAIILVALILIASFFLVKGGYIVPFPPFDDEPPPEEINETSPPPEIPTPPTSFIPSFRRDVSPDDEGVHYDKIRITREWWYYSAVFNDKDSELKNWTVVISFNHMARGDLLGTLKPDVLVVSLYSNDGDQYGGMINKKRYLGILNSGTLVASSPGVNVEFEKSWTEGEYPNWHVHAEDLDIDSSHEIVVDLDYRANSLPIWTIGSRAFDQSKSSIANYLFTGCNVSGTIKIDNQEFQVKGIGHHEHSWSPNAITKKSINGWDWFHMLLDNGWIVYMTNYYPTPQAVTSKLANSNPFGTVLVSTDNGESFTELKNLEFKITRTDNQIFPFVKMPIDFDVIAQPSINPIYLVSQSLLYGTNTELDIDIKVRNDYDKIWKFPTYLGMKISQCEVEGTLSWSNDGDHEMPIHGIGTSWSMRALL
jgi:predicted secreted hydrolase